MNVRRMGNDPRRDERRWTVLVTGANRAVGQVAGTDVGSTDRVSAS
jgi:hypothetical protein